MSYRVLMLPPTTQMTPEVCRSCMTWSRLERPFSGRVPQRRPASCDYPRADGKGAALAMDLWGDMDGVTLNQHSFGKGMTYWGLTVDEVLTRLKTSPTSPPVARWITRPRGCIVTRQTRIFTLSRTRTMCRCISTRASALPERMCRCGVLWTARWTVGRPCGYKTVALIDQRTGNRQPGLQPALYSAESGFTTVPLDLAERESVFVVFRNAGGCSDARCDAGGGDQAVDGYRAVDAEFPGEVWCSGLASRCRRLPRGRDSSDDGR